jgi:hypothetical protein
MHASIWKFAYSALFLVLVSRLPAAEQVPVPSRIPEIPNLHTLATRSGYAFAGTVKAVERISPRNKESVAVMRITFYVDKGYRGVRTGQTISIHEWSGLWQSGEHYRVGERVVLFLYPLSKLGLTSPVPNGRFPIDSSGQVVLPPAQPPSPTRPAPGRLPGSFRLSPQEFGLALRLAERE